MSSKLVSTLIKAFSWLLLGISAVLIVYIFLDPLLSDNSLPVIERAPRSELGIYWAYILTAIACLLAFIFPVIELIKNPKGGLKVLAIIALMAIVILVSYSMADPTHIQGTANNEDFSNESILLLTDTGLFATYALIGISVLAVLFASLKGVFSK